MAAAVMSDAAPDGSYRPFLDGMRAVAVYLVVAFHAGAGSFSGGFIGVDVFFVLSGYLVTEVLLRDLVPTGSVRFRRFYARRVRRLLPAAFVVLAVTAVTFSSLGSQVEKAESLGAFKSAFVYLANWFFISESSQYFAPDVSSNPVLHFWSLAVEEQFYLLWPLLLAGLYALGRPLGPRRAGLLRLVVGAGALTSLAWAWSLRSSDPLRAYYGTDARAYQLLTGALLALSPEVIGAIRRWEGSARWAGWAAVGALVTVASSWVELDPIERGAAATLLTAVLIVSLEAARGGALQGSLSTGPVVYLGKVSYGTYLWHWPVVLVITRRFDLSGGATVAFTALVATALASLSYQLLEHPIRMSGLLDRYRTTVIGAGLATSVIGASLLMPAILERSEVAPTVAAVEDDDLEVAGSTPVPDLDWVAVKADFPGIPNCFGEPATACTEVLPHDGDLCAVARSRDPPAAHRRRDPRRWVSRARETATP